MVGLAALFPPYKFPTFRNKPYFVPFCPSVRPSFGQPSGAKAAEEQRKTTIVSSSSPKAKRPEARIVPALRTGEPTWAVHKALPNKSRA